jgi:hypothetical protein
MLHLTARAHADGAAVAQLSGLPQGVRMRGVRISSRHLCIDSECAAVIATLHQQGTSARALSRSYVRVLVVRGRRRPCVA